MILWIDFGMRLYPLAGEIGAIYKNDDSEHEPGTDTAGSGSRYYGITGSSAGRTQQKRSWRDINQVQLP